ncbi:hypothetical protein F5141DRAFT_1067386 [Pisolithus sp. B1]|nr:hypothetical protein F5141DRAFT_1067386 [Pisolithus sp. B1]
MASSQAALALCTAECRKKNLSPCSVLEAQWEKACLHAAQNWERKKVKLLAGVNVCSNRDIDCIPDQCSIDGHVELTSFLHSSTAIPPLPIKFNSITMFEPDLVIIICTILPGKSTKTNPGDSAGEPMTIIPSAISITAAPSFSFAAPDSDDNSDLDEFDTDEDEDGDDGSTLTLQEIIHISSDEFRVQE